MQPSTTFLNHYIFYPATCKQLAFAHGKWIIPCLKPQMDALWQSLKSFADVFLAHNNYLLCIKASTACEKYQFENGTSGVVMVYVRKMETELASTHAVTRIGNAIVEHLKQTTDHSDVFASSLVGFAPHGRIYYKTEQQSKRGTRVSGIRHGNTFMSLALSPICVKDKHYDIDLVMQDKSTDTISFPTTTNDANLIRLGMVWNSQHREWAVVDDKSCNKVIECLNMQTEQQQHRTDIATVAIEETKHEEHVCEVVCMSINVWGIVDGIFKDRAAPLAERMDGILAVVEAQTPDVLCLQEVTAEVWTHLHQKLCLAGYATEHTKTFNETSFETMVYYHTVLLQPMQTHAIGTSIMDLEQHRVSPLVEFVHKSSHKTFCVGTFHLPSGANHASFRYHCLHVLFERLYAFTKRGIGWVVLGDSNIPYKQDFQSPFVFPSFVSDVWEATGRNSSKRATYNPHLNTNITHLVDHTPGCRFDRAFFDNSHLKTTCFHLVCTNPLPQSQKHASDHFGICATFVVT